MTITDSQSTSADHFVDANNKVHAAGDFSPATCSPVRVTLSRRKGWRMPPDTVKVSRPGPWGNPFRVGDGLHATNGECVRSYRLWVTQGINVMGDAEPPTEEEIADLRGKNLACWCKQGEPCHADVLLDLAKTRSAARRITS